MNSPIEIYLRSTDAYMKMTGGDEYNSDMIFYFTQPIMKPFNYDMNIRLSNIVMPLSFTLINDRNNALVVQIDRPNLDYLIEIDFRNNTLLLNGSRQVSLPFGRESPGGLATLLNTLTSPYGINVSFQDSRFRFISDQPFSLQGDALIALGFSSSSRIESIDNLIESPLISPPSTSIFRTYKVPHGNYNANSLRETLLELMESDGFDIEFEFSSLKYIFTNTTGDFRVFEDSTLFEIIGFTKQDHHSLQKSLQSDAVCNFTGENMVYVSLENIGTQNLESSTGGVSRIIKSIPISTNLGSVLIWENMTNSYSTIQNAVITFFHVRLLGEEFLPLNLNYQDWNMTLEVSFTPSITQSELKDLNFQDIINKYVQNLQSTDGTDQSQVSNQRG